MSVIEVASTRALRNVFLVIALLSGGAALNAGPQNQTITISVDDPRPVAAVAENLEKQYGWVITYEDPAYVHSSDMADLTYRMRKATDGSKPKVFGVRGGPFTFTYAVPAGVREPRVEAVLESLLQQHHAGGNPGMYRTLQTGPVFHVVPWKRKGSGGAVEARGSLLDSKISVMDGERSAYEMLQAIISAVSQVNGSRVVMGTVPLTLLARVRVQNGANNESARTVLLRLLDSLTESGGGPAWKLSWQLLYDPTPPGLYAFNLHFVRGVAR